MSHTGVGRADGLVLPTTAAARIATRKQTREVVCDADGNGVCDLLPTAVVASGDRSREDISDFLMQRHLASCRR